MSYQQPEMLEGILTIFVEAQRIVSQRDRVAMFLEAQLARRNEQNRLLYHLDGKRKRDVLQRAKTPEARLTARNRYLATRVLKQRPARAVAHCACGNKLHSIKARVCAGCRFGLAPKVTESVLSALRGGLTERQVASSLGINRSMVHRIKRAARKTVAN